MINQLKKVKPGDPISAGMFNAVIDELNRLRKVSAGPGINILSNAGGIQIGLARTHVAPVWATLDEDLTSSGTAATATRWDETGTIEVKGDRMIEVGMKLVEDNTIVAVWDAGEWHVIASKECPVEE